MTLSGRQNFCGRLDVVATALVGNHQTATLSGVPCIVITCLTDLGNFEVEVNNKLTS